jgi:V/A-type H+-transporting ATPase subunit I
VIAPMEKLFIVGPKRLAPTILLDLQRAGVVQIDPLRTEEIKGFRLNEELEARLRRWEEVSISADHALRLLGLEPDSSVKRFDGELEEAQAAVSSCEHRAEVLVAREQSLRDELDLIEQYQEVVEVLAEAARGLDESPRLEVLPFLVMGHEELGALAQELGSTLNGRFLLAAQPVGGRVVAFIVVLKRDAEEAKGVLSHQGLAELPRPGEYTGLSLKGMALRLAELSRLAPEELAASEEALRRLKKEEGGGLKSLWNRAKDESGRLHALKDAASGRYGFALFGWVPVRLKDKVEEVMRRCHDRILYIFEPVDDHGEAERIPVMLENPGWIRPFESLISFLNTPRYDSWDPTWVVALFFPLWFGMIVGDIGYAMVFALVAAYLSGYIRRGRTLTVDFFKLRLSPSALTQVLRVLRPMIAWTVIWGFLYGEFFGDLFQRVGLFGTMQHPGLIPVLIPRTDTAVTANGLILVSIGFGVCQVLYGFYLKASRTRRQGERRHFWEATGYFGGVAALVLFAYAFMAESFRPWLVVLVAAGATLFLIGMIRGRMPLMIAELPTQGGHILSYIRIYAVGLASAILADLTTDMGFSLYHLLGIAGLVVGALAGLLIGLVVHALLIALLTIGHVLQPIRLIWVEFFTKFDFYTLSGRPYRPFKSVGGSS